MRMNLISKVITASLIVPYAHVAIAADGDAEAKDNQDVIEEVYVTARRQSESLQDVPTSISAVTEDMLQNAGITEITEYLKQVPNVSVFNTDAAETRISMRGFKSPRSSGAATVGVYMDETPVTGGLGEQVALRSFDVERVEVLRGPQGSLYGEGSMSGAIKAIMNKPSTEEFAGAIALDAGTITDGDVNKSADVMLNLPLISDKLAVRMTGSYKEFGGWIDMPNLSSGAKKDANDNESKDWRIAARYFTTDKLTIDAFHMESKVDVNGTNESTRDHQLLNSVLDTSYVESSLTSLTFRYDLGWAELISVSSYWDRDNLLVGGFTQGQVDSFGPIFGGLPVLFAGLLGMPELVPEATATGWTGHTSGHQDFISTTERFTQEFRLSSTTENKYFWTLGVFYKDSESESGSDIFFLPGIFNAAGNGLLKSSVVDEFQSIALYGEITYNITEDFEVAVGGRYFDEERDTTSLTSGLLAYWDFTPPGLPEAVAAKDTPILSTSSASYTEFLPKFSAKYRVNDDAMVYFLAGKGFRSGGINLNNATNPSFEPDYSVSYEVGVKANLFDRRAVLNGAFYHMDWKDFQQVARGELFGNFVANIGSVHTRGAELEMTAFLSPDLTVGVSYGVVFEAETDGTIDLDLRDDVEDILPSGSPLTNVPDFNASIYATYEKELADNLTGIVNLNYTTIGDSKAGGFGGDDLRTNDSYSLLNLNLTVKTDNMSISLYANNLTDEFATIFNLGAENPDHFTTNAPRAIGLKFRKDF